MIPDTYAHAADMLAAGSLPILAFNNLGRKTEVIGSVREMRALPRDSAHELFVLPIENPAAYACLGFMAAGYNFALRTHSHLVMIAPPGAFNSKAGQERFGLNDERTFDERMHRIESYQPEVLETAIWFANHFGQQRQSVDLTARVKNTLRAHEAMVKASQPK